MKKLSLGLALGLTVLATSAMAQNTPIYAGGQSGAYFGQLCPALAKPLNSEGYTFECAVTNGTPDNIDRVLKNPGTFALAQFDAFANWAAANPDAAAKIEVVRSDLGREAVFMLSRNTNSFGDVVTRATRVKWALPPQTSGAVATFRYFGQALPNVFGRVSDRNITYHQNAAEAIRAACTQDNVIALIVQLPDPRNDNFKLINGFKEPGCNYIPVGASRLADLKVGETNVYSLETRPVTESGLISNAKTVTTLTTPVVLITQKPSAAFAAGSNDEKNHKEAIDIVRGLSRNKIVPADPAVASLFNKAFTATKETASAIYRSADDAIRGAGN